MTGWHPNGHEFLSRWQLWQLEHPLLFFCREAQQEFTAEPPRSAQQRDYWWLSWTCRVSWKKAKTQGRDSQYTSVQGLSSQRGHCLPDAKWWGKGGGYFSSWCKCDGVTAQPDANVIRMKQWGTHKRFLDNSTVLQTDFGGSWGDWLTLWGSTSWKRSLHTLASASREGARRKCRNCRPWATHIKGDSWQERGGEKAGILVGSEDACTLKLEFAVVRVDEGEAAELLLVDGLHHCRINRGQRGLLRCEVTVKVVGIHLGFLKHSQSFFFFTDAVKSAIQPVQPSWRFRQMNHMW